LGIKDLVVVVVDDELHVISNQPKDIGIVQLVDRLLLISRNAL
jgi:hypothetical protein